MSWPMTNNELLELVEKNTRAAHEIMIDVSYLAEETCLSGDTEDEIHRVVARLALLLELLRHD